MNRVEGQDWYGAGIRGRESRGLSLPHSSPKAIERWFVIGVILLIDSLPHFSLKFGTAGDAADGGSPVAQLVWGLTYACGLTGIIIERRRAGVLLKRSIPIVALVALIALSVFWSGDPGLSTKRAFGLFGTTALAYYVVCRFTLAEFVEIFAIATGLSAALSLFAVFALPTGKEYAEAQYAGAWQGVYTEKNQLGEAMAIEILTLLAIPWDRKPTRRTWLVIGTLLLSSLLLLGSRSASSLLLCGVTLVIAGFALLWRWQPRSRGWLTGVLAVGLFGGLSAAMLGMHTSDIFEMLGRDSTLTGRTDIWAYVQTAISDHPYLGFGYSTFWVPGGPIDAYLPADQGWLPYHAHNGFLELALDVGWIGVGLFAIGALLGIVGAIRVFAKDPLKSGIWPLAMIVYFLLVNLDESSIAKYNNLSWVVFVIAFLFAVSSGTLEEPEQIEP